MIKSESSTLHVGYEDVKNYYYGRSFYNKSIMGWAGHTENGSTLGSVEG